MIPGFVRTLFTELRHRGFELAPDDFEALRLALWAGFGWESRQAFCALLTTLWAKSRQEQTVLAQLFAQVVPTHELEAWQMAARETSPEAATPQPPYGMTAAVPEAPAIVQTRPPSGDSLSRVPLDASRLSSRPLLFVPQFPLTYREIAQAWRRLRRPVREGPLVELDVDATIAQRSRLGLKTPPVLAPRRRNTSRLTLLIDREGSMTPFHAFVASVGEAICHAGQLEQAETYYFHDQPATGADRAMLDTFVSGPMPTLDAILPQITPLVDGELYTDADLYVSRPVTGVLATITRMTSVVLLSDAGAARGQYDLERLLDTVAFLKAVRQQTPHVVWMNPLPSAYWTGSTAAQIARYVPMFPLDKEGMYRAVNVLRGGYHALERAI